MKLDSELWSAFLRTRPRMVITGFAHWLALIHSG
jgi:hypothetical protein